MLCILCGTLLLSVGADDPYARATKLVAQMTTAEKMQFIQGAGTAMLSSPNVLSCLPWHCYSSSDPYARFAASTSVRATLGHSVSGNSSYVGVIKGLPRLGIPDIRMNDGPQGFRGKKGQEGTSTQWPSGLTVAHSWDTALFKGQCCCVGGAAHRPRAAVQMGGVGLNYLAALTLPPPLLPSLPHFSSSMGNCNGV